ncbi:D-alanine-D-alanine ligase or related ATP-grasp enzyme (DdlA) (PDB:1E4E) [Commensalibacter communis]|uniref:biotin carboxylase n=1 Tax=Commensalibacter communis TaxID=2972786 RepID=UPI0022FF9ACF|nr:biotin carboxylase [Commensalibacter communis]CAI3934295.1 D-alanine-D-alanine ligase or related ATP-grasp enzyme (DdlA) (PDB:1E4E) [Commensalibacter communis]
MSEKNIALLYQALPPPMIDGLRKDGKPGGYSDGGADIAFTLKQHHRSVVTPTVHPAAEVPFDWVFPDTEEGIKAALKAGATHFWLNTVLFEGHPIEKVPANIYKIGQTPKAMQRFDDKFITNKLLLQHGLPVAQSYLVGQKVVHAGILSLADLQSKIDKAEMVFPLVVKPVRGRGSQGVSVVHDFKHLQLTIEQLQQGQKFGSYFMVEELLEGKEITLTIMPPVSGLDRWQAQSHYWALRPVHRFNQTDYIAPYNGDIPVTENSAAISLTELQSPEMQVIVKACVKAAEIVEARAPIRIDCRANKEGIFKIFDLNMKPNMTGAGRPGREKQDCLSMISIRAEGWEFIDLLDIMIASAWR